MYKKLNKMKITFEEGANAAYMHFSNNIKTKGIVKNHFT
jgi:phage FluMu protein Com